MRGLTSREHALLTHATLEADLAARRRALADAEAAAGRVLGGDQAKLRRAEELKSEAAQLELSVGAAWAEYERVKAANKKELERVSQERRAELSAMVEALAATQVAAGERLLEAWLQLAGDVGAAPEQLAAARSGAAAAAGVGNGGGGGANGGGSGWAGAAGGGGGDGFGSGF